MEDLDEGPEAVERRERGAEDEHDQRPPRGRGRGREDCVLGPEPDQGGHPYHGEGGEEEGEVGVFHLPRQASHVAQVPRADRLDDGSGGHEGQGFEQALADELIDGSRRGS